MKKTSIDNLEALIELNESFVIIKEEYNEFKVELEKLISRFRI